MRLTSFSMGFVPRSISILAMLGVLALPAIAGATGGAGSDGGGDVGSGEGTASAPASTGEDMTGTGGGTVGGGTDTDSSNPPDDDKKGCSIGGHGTASGMLALALLGLHGLRRRRS